MKKIKLLSEFKQFAMKGNVMDMAVGVIIGTAFGKIISSLVNDIVMPGFSFITGRVNFTELAVNVGIFGENEAPVQIKYGMFLQNVLDFIIIAVCVFIAVKLINSFKRKNTEEEKPKEPPKQEVLLEEIRDSLKEGSK